MKDGGHAFHESLGFAMESACAFCNRLHTEPTVLGSVWCSGSLPQISFTEELDQQESQNNLNESGISLVALW